MSGFYNVVFGVNPWAGVLLRILEIHPQDVPRLRDCWWTGKEVLIYTRTGGGNRADYADQLAKLHEHPCFLREVNDKFDSTYMALYFSMPPDYLDLVQTKVEPETRTPDQRWQEDIAKLQTDPEHSRKMAEKLAPMLQPLVDHLNKK